MIWFDRGNARDLTAIFELRVRVLPRRRGMPFELRIDEGRLRVRPGAPSDPGATATIGARDLVLLAIGSATWAQLLSRQRLELAGDPFLALRLPTLFRLPARARGASRRRARGASRHRSAPHPPR